jgi:threonine/homoserine/homoserine lactone efflux protein
MPFDTWLVYTAAVFILTVTPGPSVLNVVSTSVNHGFRQGALGALGSTTAIVGIMVLSAAGLGAVLAASETAFSVVKWAGAAYLAWIGIASLRSAGASLALPEAGAGAPAVRGRDTFVRGLLVGASNPKALVFFTALFPQFMDPARAQGPQFLVLGLTFVAFELGWLLTYAALGLRARQWLQRPGRAAMFDRATGGIFLLAAGLLAMTRRAAA